ncbi:MAG: YicC family protein [Flavobacteriaceae bacterium]|nr:YicC family protein [Flavobacteriaceae bacterium]
MIQSMTGYGKAVIQLSTKKISIEIKSLNSKNLDLNVRMPSIYREKEMAIRKQLAKVLLRGKIDFGLFVEITGEDSFSKINQVIVKDYISQLAEIVDGNKTELLKMAISMPDALKKEREEIDQEEYEIILKTINEALDAIVTYRNDEGKALEKDILTRSENISKLLSEILALDPERIILVKERLHKALSDLKEEVDSNRFEQELIYYLEKYDITEEKVRLENHLQYFEDALNSSDSNGKKLGFICQEIGREINTIGSKSNHAPMQQLVVQMKDELEKIKEQILNVL